MTDGYLNVEDDTYFRQGKRRVKDTYLLGLNQNQYQRDTVRNAYGRQRGDLVQQYAQLRDRIPGSFAARGMLNSGMQEKAWRDFKDQRQNAYANLAGQRDDQLSGLTLARNQLASTRAGTLDDLEEQRTARLAAVASTLRSALY
jgi:hypothetical protein